VWARARTCMCVSFFEVYLLLRRSCTGPSVLSVLGMGLRFQGCLDDKNNVMELRLKRGEGEIFNENIFSACARLLRQDAWFAGLARAIQTQARVLRTRHHSTSSRRDNERPVAAIHDFSHALRSLAISRDLSSFPVLSFVSLVLFDDV